MRITKGREENAITGFERYRSQKIYDEKNKNIRVCLGSYAALKIINKKYCIEYYNE